MYTLFRVLKYNLKRGKEERVNKLHTLFRVLKSERGKDERVNDTIMIRCRVYPF